MEFKMKVIIPILLLLAITLQAKYLSSETCKECHEDIHYEHMKSMHSKSSVFSDEVHAKVKEAVNREKYSCALCHMPSTKNLSAMIRGQEQPNPDDVRQTDGVSCMYCHQIRKLHYGKTYNINFVNSSNGPKQTMYGNLKNAEDSDEHNVAPNHIYTNSEVCMGCHSHKQNALAFEVCNSKNEYDKTSDCIGCHMPKAPGGVEKFNKKGRDEYATHEFLGIRSDEMVKKAVKLELSYANGTIELTISNKMGHAVITHPMRLKFAKTVVTRDGKVIWSNFEKSPVEDKEATFIIVFKDDKDETAMPHNAIGYKLNRNLKASESKTIKYEVDGLKKGDEITSTWISYVVNPKIAKKLKLKLMDVAKPLKGVETAIVVR